MSRREAVAWTIVVVLTLLVIIGLGNNDADAERAARLAAEHIAQRAQHDSDSLKAVLRDSTAKLRQAAEIEADSADAARERAQVAESSAGHVADRLRAKLTAEQQEELDAVTTYYQTALEEEREVTRRTENQLRLARAELEAERSFRLRETERADRWKTAYDAATVEIAELRRPSLNLLKIEWDDVPKIAAAAAIGYLAGR